MSTFSKLAGNSGSYSLPYLVKLYNEDESIVLRFVDNTENVIYNGQTFKAAAMNYKPNSDVYGFDGGGTFQIECSEDVIEIVESSNSLYLDVIGAMLDDGSVTEINRFKHHYGTINCSDRKMTFTFEKDDRLEMSFPALIFSAYNNRGNS